MKYSTLPALEKHLQGAAPQHFAPIYMVLAKDRFTRKNAVSSVVSALLRGQKHPEHCLKHFNEDHLNMSDVLEELHTLNLFIERKVISVEFGEKATVAILKELQATISQPLRETFLILSAASISHSSNFYKQIEKLGVILEVPEEKEWEKEKTLTAWLIDRLSKSGKTIAPEVCLHLVKQVGTELAILHTEVDKLLCYVGDRPQITLQDIGAICASVNIENAWQLGEAIFNRNTSVALRIIKALLEEGTQFLTLLRQIRHQFQTEFTICSILASGGSSADVTRQFPYMKGSILDRHMRTARSYGISRFKKAIQLIDETEVAAKNSGGDPDLFAELLIIKLSID